MKKILAALLAMVLCVSLLASCGDKNETASSAAEPEEVTIKTVSMFGGSDASAEAYASVVADFDAANEYITVVDESQESDETWKASVVSSFESGDNADVVFFFTTSDADGILDYVVSLDEIRAEYPDYCNWINESAINAVTATNGTQYAIPVKGYWEGLFVNEDLYTANGIDLPTDWAKFTGSFDALNEAGIIPMAFGADIPHYWIEHFILCAGTVEDHAANPGTDVSAVPASWYTGLGYFKSLYDLGGFATAAPSTDYTTACEQFINKLAALSVDGSWWCGSITDPDTTTVMAMPTSTDAGKDTTDVIAGYSSGFYIARSAWEDEAKRDACVAFVEAATSPEAVAKYVEQGGAPTCAITPDPDAETARPAADGAAAVGAADGVDMPLGDRMATAYAEFISGASKIMDGSTTVDDVIAAFCEANK